MSIVKKVLLVLTSAAIVFCALGAFALSTSTGLYLLVKLAESSLTEFTVAETDGQAFNAALKDVRFKTAGLEFEGDLAWRINSGALFSGQLLFEHIELADSTLSVDTTEMLPSESASPAESGTFSLPSLPVKLAIESLNIKQLELQYNDIHAQLDRLQAVLRWDESGIDLPTFLVNGSWNQYALNLDAAIQCLADGTLSIEKTQLALGDNQLALNGWLELQESDPRFDLSLHASAFDFERFLPTMKGHLKGRAHLAGSLFSPRLQGELDLDKFSFQDNRIDKVRWRAYATSEGLAFEANTRLTIEQAHFAGLVLDEAVLQADGSAPKHKARLRVTSPQGRLIMALDAGFDAKHLRWQGELKEMTLENPYGPITMTQPLRVSYDHPNHTVTIKGGEWMHELGRLGVSEPISMNVQDRLPFDLKLSLNELNSAYLNRYLNENLRLKGQASAILSAQVPQDWASLPMVDFDLASRDFQARYRSLNDDFLLQLDTVNIKMHQKEGQLTTEMLVKIAKNGQIRAQLTVDDILKTRRLSGQFNIDDLAMAIFNPFLDEGEKAEGALNGHLAFAGDLKKPQLRGQLQLQGLEVNSTRLPFEMQKSDVTLQFAGSEGTLHANLNTPQGHLAFDGAVNWDDVQNVTAWVSAKTPGVRVSVPPLLQVNVNSDVSCRLANGTMYLKGDIGIPWARVAVRDLPPSAVDVSDDVVRLDRPRKRKTQIRSTIPLESDLFINVGDDVHVQAFGLNAELQGRLHVVQFDNQFGLNGQMTVPEGRFKAYGQDLIVTKGEFIFAGSASNPLLNLEAIRNPDSTADGVTAGVRVTGTANRPQLTLFSDPAMSQTEALSYLMRGEGLNPDGDSDNTMLTSALINLGLTQGNRVIGAIGESIGISGLGVETEGVGEDSSVAVSGYILPGLKVKYGVGLFDSLATITLRYQILPRLYIEAASGVDQALDVLYTFEFN